MCSVLMMIHAADIKTVLQLLCTVTYWCLYIYIYTHINIHVMSVRRLQKKTERTIESYKRKAID